MRWYEPVDGARLQPMGCARVRAVREWGDRPGRRQFRFDVRCLPEQLPSAPAAAPDAGAGAGAGSPNAVWLSILSAFGAGVDVPYVIALAAETAEEKAAWLLAIRSALGTMSEAETALAPALAPAAAAPGAAGSGHAPHHARALFTMPSGAH